MTFKAGSEDEVHWSIKAWLEAVLPGCFVMHIANGFHAEGDRRERARHVARLKSLGMVPGAADLLIFTRDGRPFFIEVKRPKGGVVSDDQIAFGAAVTERQVPWRVCVSVDEARQFLADIGIQTREAVAA